MEPSVPFEDDASVFRFLFRLSADARLVPIRQFLRRLVTGLANHYAAATCSIYLSSARGLLAKAEPSLDLEDLVEQHQEAILKLGQRLVERSFQTGELTSAMDLVDPESDVKPTEDEMLQGWDVFAFPLNTSGGTRAVVVLFLGDTSRSLGETDIQALMALGEVLEVGAEKTLRPAPQQ